MAETCDAAVADGDDDGLFAADAVDVDNDDDDVEAEHGVRAIGY